MFPSITNSISQKYEIANQSDSTKHKITERVFTGEFCLFIVYFEFFERYTKCVSLVNVYYSFIEVSV